MPDIIDQCIENKDTEMYKLMHDLLSADTPNDAIKKWKETSRRNSHDERRNREWRTSTRRLSYHLSTRKELIVND